MKISDFFSINSPQCLFCQESINLLNNKTGYNDPEYYCKDCNEIFIPVEKVNQFYFSLLDIAVLLDFKIHEMYIINQQTDVISQGLPLSKLNFKNRHKLVKKLKTYITFS